MQPDQQNQNLANKQAWDRLYASTSDLVWGAGTVGFLAEFLRPEIAGGRSFRRVLDAATGEGRNLPLLLDLAGELSACDASEAALGKMPAEIKRRVRLAHCDLAQTPFPDASFDFILLCDTVETLPDAAPVFREMLRILAPGGALVCNIPGPEGDVAGIDMTAIGEEKYLYRGSYFYKFFRDHEVAQLLAATGWQAVRSEVMTWTEAPHPGFRLEPHQHRSRVYLLTAAPPSPAPAPAA
jgi:SAM-dependent methyltransferase